MNLFNYGLYRFNYFNKAHIQYLIAAFILSAIFVIIPYFLSNNTKKIYQRVMGYIFLLIKVLESLNRHFVEQEPLVRVVPLNLCNVAFIIAAFYLITNKDLLFNVLFFWFTGAILALALPNYVYYRLGLSLGFYFLVHMLEISVVVYGFLHNSPKITKKYLLDSILLYLLLMAVAFSYNKVFGTNFMYIQTYIISAVSFIKPIILYRILFITLNILFMTVLYLPFISPKTNYEIKEEYII